MSLRRASCVAWAVAASLGAWTAPVLAETATIINQGSKPAFIAVRYLAEKKDSNGPSGERIATYQVTQGWTKIEPNGGSANIEVGASGEFYLHGRDLAGDMIRFGTPSVEEHVNDEPFESIRLVLETDQNGTRETSGHQIYASGLKLERRVPQGEEPTKHGWHIVTMYKLKSNSPVALMAAAPVPAETPTVAPANRPVAPPTPINRVSTTKPNAPTTRAIDDDSRRPSMKPDAETPKPDLDAPKPVADAEKPGSDEAPKPVVAEASKPGNSEAAKPVVDAPSMPKPAAPAPETVVEARKPEVKEPAPRPEPAEPPKVAEVIRRPVVQVPKPVVDAPKPPANRMLASNSNANLNETRRRTIKKPSRDVVSEEKVAPTDASHASASEERHVESSKPAPEPVLTHASIARPFTGELPISLAGTRSTLKAFKRNSSKQVAASDSFVWVFATNSDVIEARPTRDKSGLTRRVVGRFTEGRNCQQIMLEDQPNPLNYTVTRLSEDQVEIRITGKTADGQPARFEGKLETATPEFLGAMSDR